MRVFLFTIKHYSNDHIGFVNFDHQNYNDSQYVMTNKPKRFINGLSVKLKCSTKQVDESFMNINFMND